MKKVLSSIWLLNFTRIDFVSLDDDEDEGKRDKKSRPARHTDTNRRRNTESSTAKPRQLAQEYQKPVNPSSFFLLTLLAWPSFRMICSIYFS